MKGGRNFSTNLKSLNQGDNFRKAGIFVDRIENMVEIIRAFGQDPVKIMTSKNIDGEYEFDFNISSFGTRAKPEYHKQINNGLLRNLIEKQHTEVLNSLDYFMSEPFVNPNKIDKLNWKKFLICS